MTGADLQEVGWDGGFLLANNNGGGPEGRDEEVYASKNGRAWHAATPEPGIGSPSCCGRVVAAHGTAAYLLGWNARDELVVWRTEDGERWQAIPLGLTDLVVRDRLDLDVAIAAGPYGVMVAGQDAFHPPRHHGAYMWYSPDGRTFTAVTKIPSPIDTVPVVTALQATPDGFLLGMTVEDGTRLLSSKDGAQWEDIGRGLTQVAVIDHMSGNADSTVVFTRRPGSEEPVPWYRSQGEWRQATIDPGRLPDAGVVPADQRRVAAVRNWGTGYIAVGHTFGNEGQGRSGLVWYSADGSTWTRMPIRDNGFDTAWPLMDLAVSRHTAVLIGCRFDSTEWLLTWEADAPPLPKRG